MLPPPLFLFLFLFLFLHSKILDFWNCQADTSLVNPSNNFALTGHAAIEAVASPARLEILSALGDEPMTTQELAQRLGRSRQSLYYHLDVLAQTGLVTIEEPAEGERERRFRVKPKRVAIGARRGSPRERKAGAKVLQAMLRLTAREATAALADPATRFDGALREMIGVRGKARFTEAQLRRANELIDQLEALLTEAKSGSPADGLYAVTVVLTPAREAGTTDNRNRGK
jgi:DNA-binding transcriptional ArsR family regulator